MICDRWSVRYLAARRLQLMLSLTWTISVPWTLTQRPPTSDFLASSVPLVNLTLDITKMLYLFTFITILTLTEKPLCDTKSEFELFILANLWKVARSNAHYFPPSIPSTQLTGFLSVGVEHFYVKNSTDS